MTKITLCLTLEKEIGGYWDYGPKKYFEWNVEHRHRWGARVRVGSWEANHWFYSTLGKTDKQTLGWAKNHIRRIFKPLACEFKYKEERW